VLARADGWYQRYLALADASRPMAGPTSTGPESL
jgi:hypothetical protein